MNKEYPIHFTPFSSSIDHIKLPDTFTFPFYYEPHELCRIAADELQEHRLINHQYNHNFGLDDSESGLIIGKMFGVLIVQSAEGKVGYLSAFSGKLADSNHHEGFVPPIYDMLVDGSHFKQEEIIINDYTIQIDKLEGNEHYRNLKSSLEEAKRKAKETIAQTKVNIKTAKVERRKQRETMKSKLDQNAYDSLLEQLKEQSIQSSYYLKDEIKYWDERIKKAEQLSLIHISEPTRPY